jgi:protein phosphatase
VEVDLIIYGISNTGAVRSQNQDSYIIADLEGGTILSHFSARRLPRAHQQTIQHQLGKKGCLLVVADGMGGAAAGDLASQLGVELLAQEIINTQTKYERSIANVPNLLKICIERVNLRIWEESRTNIEYRGMGTTLTAVIILDDTLFIAQIGDSRAYLLRRQEFEQITKDQSAIQMLIDLGRLTKEQAATAPNRNIILQALGADPLVQVALSRLKPCNGDILLLCSDGLSNKIQDLEMHQILQETSSLGEACQTMVTLANQRGGEDNITLVTAQLLSEHFPAPDGVESTRIGPTLESLTIFFPEGRRGYQTSKLPKLNLGLDSPPESP